MYVMDRQKQYEILNASLNEHNFNPLNDVIFKFVFGKPERKQILIDFLNAIVSEDLGHPICDLEFAPTELIPGGYDEKLTRLDVLCTLDTGEQVDIEVQVVNRKNMKRRTLCYWARMYLMGLPPGGNYNEVKPCITVNLLRFNLLPQKEAHSLWSIYNIQSGDRLNKDLVLHFLEIPKFLKQPAKPVRKMTKMERWLAFFANKMTGNEKEELIMSEAAINDAMKAAREFLQNTAERRAYINREMAIIDYNTDRQDAYEDGMKEGIAKGKAEGMTEGIAKGKVEGEAKGKAEAERKYDLLVQRLFAEHKLDDLQRASQDKQFREELYKKYGI